MGTPADKLSDDDIASKYGLGGDDDIATKYGLGEDAPDPVINTEQTAPLEPPVPATAGKPDVGPAEAAWRTYGNSLSGGALSHLDAGNSALANWINSKLGMPAEAAGPGIDAPIRGYADYYRDSRERLEAGKEQHPKGAVLNTLVGGAQQAVALPAVRAAQGAGVLARTGAGLANVGVDAGLAATTAGLEAPAGRELEAAGEALAPSAAVSTALRAPGAARTALDVGRKASLAFLPENLRPAAEKLSAFDAAGAEARASARRGQQALDPTTRSITKTLSEGEEMTDAILDYAKVGMKRAPIVKAMAAEGVDAQQAVMKTGGTVERIAMEIEELSALPPGNMQVSGKQALNHIRDAFEATRDQFAESYGRTLDEGGDAAADLFMRVDQLKRHVGQAVKKASAGATPDPMVEDALMRHYQELRSLLEDPQVWGEGAATVQREVNAAWTPWLTTRRAFSKKLLADEPIERGADGFSELADADPRKVGSVLSSADDAAGDRDYKILRRGLENQSNLTGTLAKHYDAPPEIVDKAASVAQGSNQILETFDRTRGDLMKARDLRDVSAASGAVPFLPRLGSAINAASAAEDFVRQSPKLAATARGAGKVAEPVRKVAAMQAGRSTAQAQHEDRERIDQSIGAAMQGTNEKLAGMNAENDRQKADLDRLLGNAAQPVDDDAGAYNLATQDEQRGQALAGKTGDDRATAYAVLMHTDPQFRARQRERAKQLQKQQEERQQEQ